MNPQEDPRPLLGRALDQAERLVAGVRADQLDAPTPCSEFDVRTLLGHLVAVLRRIAHVATGGDPFDVPRVAADVADDAWAAAFRADRATLDAAWSDDAVLARMLTLPFGEMPGRAAAVAYTQELTVHGWDLAAATGRTDELHPSLGAIALEIAQQFIPAEPRGGRVPFGPVVPVSEDADTYSRLAGWLGRQPVRGSG